MKTQKTMLITCFILLLLGSCGKDNPISGNDDPPDPPVNPAKVTKDIGPDGGILTSKDGLVTITIPAGALGQEESITIEKISTEALGTEFDELSEASGISEVYELGPNGLQFDEAITVTFGSSQSPVQNGDSLGAGPEFLFTSSGEKLKLLDSLQTMVDLDAGSVEVRGKLSHFSPLVSTKSNNGVTFFIKGVPGQLEVGSIFTANAIIIESDTGPLAELVSVPGPAEYLDKSVNPLTPAFASEAMQLEGESVTGFTGSFDYGCTETGSGKYAAEMSVNVVFDLESESISAESFVEMESTVECIAQLFDLTVEIEGNGGGTVSSKSNGIECPDDCEESYSSGTDVILDANAAEGYKFAGWDGDIMENSANDSVITITMDQDRNVSAAFAEIPSYTLTVLKDGDGTGVVTSEPAGINYGDDNTEEYKENTIVTLTVVPDSGSVFQNWDGDLSGSENPVEIIMDQAKTVTAVFRKEFTAGQILLGLKALPVVISALETSYMPRFLLAQLAQRIQNSTQVKSAFSQADNSAPLLVQGAEGFVVFDLVTNEVILDFTNVLGNNTTFTRLRTPLGALAVSRPNPGLNTASVFASYGLDNNSSQYGFSLYPWDPQGMEYINGPVSPYPSVIDAFPIGGESISDEVVIVRAGNGGINFLRYSEPTDSYVLRSSNDNLNINRYGSVPAVTAYGEEVEGALLVVNEIGNLYFETRNPLISTVKIGNLGQRIIRLRCDLPVCVATDFDGNAVRIITWDGETQPTIIGNPIGVGSGPVDPDLFTLPNGDFVISAAGFNDNTISILTVAGNGTLLSNMLFDAPEGCIGPGHVIIEENPDDANNPFVIGTCRESANYFVNDLENSGGLFNKVGGM